MKLKSDLNFKRLCRRRRLTPVVFAVVLTFPFFWGLPVLKLSAQQTAFAGVDDNGKRSSAGPIVSYTGVKRTIAIDAIEDSIAYNKPEGPTEASAALGFALKNMLTDGLMNSEHFHVYDGVAFSVPGTDRSATVNVMLEPHFYLNKARRQGIDYLLTGSITEYSNQKGSGGLSIGGHTLGSKGGTAALAIDLQIVDATSGEIFNVIHARGSSTAKFSGFILGSCYGIGGTRPNLLAVAARDAINNAVKTICDQTERAQSSKLTRQWKGEIQNVTSNGDNLLVLQMEGGMLAGFKAGDEISIFMPDIEIKTLHGELMGRHAGAYIGRCRVTEVQKKQMTALLIEMGSFQTGDIKNYVLHSTGAAPERDKTAPK